MAKDRREQIKAFVEKEFMGPDPIDWNGLRQENGEEIIMSDPPTTRYIAGVLFPKNAKQENNSDDDPNAFSEEYEEDEKGDRSTKSDEYKTSGFEYLEDAEELIDRSNAFKQSALSITVAIKDEDKITVKVSAGRYAKTTETEKESGKILTKYNRIPILWENEGEMQLPKAKEGMNSCLVGDSGLKVDIVYRYKKGDISIFTFTLENCKEMVGSQIKDEDCFFQVKLCVESVLGFHALPDEIKINKDEDYLSNVLLYRNEKNYAIGHGCAAEWEDNKELVKHIETSIFPSYKVKPIVPSAIEGVSLSMLEMSREEHSEKVINDLWLLCDKYEEWIKRLEVTAATLNEKYIETAKRHISNCYMCLQRMRQGVDLLKQDKIVKKAFMWMNEAMLLQQLHYGLPLQKWEDDGKQGIELVAQITKLPEIYDSTTWYEANKRVYGKWRPFQLAFILMNLDSMRFRSSNERGIVDLIWFPTGGGKTEAYLGLSAYTIFIRRLLDKNNAGTAIIMRYTLRLLTAQQYERAAAMICACEVIRRKKPEMLGTDEINIGLWVGGETTPNNSKKAVSIFNELYTNKTERNPFVMLKCPWCGAQMGVVETGKNRNRHLPGYKILYGPRKTKKFVFQCENTKQNCEFSSSQSCLPLYIVDEDIYEKRPTLILGTVDKFAMLPFRPQAQGIFGYENGQKKTSPDLIIQDELHLISGPLGSMVGHYETMIHDLCSQKTHDGIIQPKIIASTATISRAKEQCHALYGCSKDKVFQFPPAGLNAGESFFAEAQNSVNGREYVGILASGSPSDATTAIRLYAALLYATKTMEVENEKDRDPYWTNIGYYNSIRELGQAQTWIKADIDQQLDVMYKRRYDDKRMPKEEYKSYRRYIWRDEELTSRIQGDKVSASLANLNISYPPEMDENGKVREYPIDICLATNMISVGLDVQRLGLMTVAGQPKTTSEYIQATSRVGRNANHAPGLIFVLYRPGRPRDKSFYEHFQIYHSKLYCSVEPTSVTPFSAPVRERALHAIMIGMMRLEHDEKFNEDPPRYPKVDIIDHVRAVIENRVRDIDPGELDDTLRCIEEVLRNWEDWNPQKWTPQLNYDMSMGDPVPLIYGTGNKPNASWLDRGMRTPTSMRSVDSSCEAQILKNRYVEREE